ncbi:MAG: hypothetical protein AB8B82_02420 [Roseovarius sp.]
MLQSEVGAPPGTQTAPVLFAGVAVAAIAIIANAWSQWQSARIANALQGLQTLRTDREYLINADVVRREIERASDSQWGAPLGASLRRKFSAKGSLGGVDHPSFRDASFFILNQYEFLAAGVRSGAIDLVLVDKTLRGPLANLLMIYSEEIAHMRRGSPRTFENLIWLHRTLSGSTKPYLGPKSF